ncbi:MAG: hypothetical protein MZV70_21265 [Desulfobacterales bacterium]|nr:hypothetical protein [Desulfobacterales bacterium]
MEGILIFAEPELRETVRREALTWIPMPTCASSAACERDITERGRTTESVIKQYESTVRPMHLEFVEPSKRYADVIIPEGGHNIAALDMVVARIEALLQ